VIDEEVGYILDLGVSFVAASASTACKALLAELFDAVFVGTGAPRGRDLDLPGRKEAAANIHIGIDWLSNVSFGHLTRSASASSCSAAATPRWIAAAPRAGSAAKT
jgi:formate dehydrogenase beta subunit